MPERYCVILTAAGSREQADGLARSLVSRRLAACVQVIPISSTYLWKEELHSESEFLLLIKTQAARYDEIQAAILQDHSYEVPEIVQLPIQRGFDRYLAWIENETSPR